MPNLGDADRFSASLRAGQRVSSAVASFDRRPRNRMVCAARCSVLLAILGGAANGLAQELNPPANGPVSVAARPKLAANSSADSSHATPAAESDGRDLDRLLTRLAREHLPERYEDTRKWGMTKEATRGLHIRLDGARIKTKRKKEQVNHGTWKYYRIEPVNLDDGFRVRLDRITPNENGTVTIEASVTSPLKAFARVSQWQLGVQLFSFGVDAEATVRLRVRAELALSWDPKHFPPDIVLQPRVTDANLELAEFRVLRISDLHGKPAEAMGNVIREVLEDKIEEKRGKIVEKINQQIVKNQDKLRLSFQELAESGWKELLDYVQGSRK